MPGIIESYIHTGNQLGVLVELSCQTKITATTSEFKTLATEIAMQIAANPNVRYVSTEDIPARIIRQIELELKSDRHALQQRLQAISLYDQFYIRDNSLTVEDLIKLRAVQLSENITVKRFSRFAIEDSNDSNPPSDPSGGVPSSPVPNSPSPLTEEAELDIWDNDVK